MTYNPHSVQDHFDSYGEREWNRLVATPVDEVSLQIHAHYLRAHVPAGARVLEIGAGAGRFTQILAGIGARVVVADLSPGQLDLNRRFAAQFGFDKAVEDWQQVDIVDLSRYPDGAFDVVVAYGGPLSYVLDQRDRALGECLRVLKPGGRLLASVMTLWGTVHRFLAGVLDGPLEFNQRVIATGDLTTETFPTRTGHFMHLFRAEEVRDWLVQRGLRVLALSASGVLATVWDDKLHAIRQDEARWAELLRMEIAASASPGCLEMGTHLIFVVEK